MVCHVVIHQRDIAHCRLFVDIHEGIAVLFRIFLSRRAFIANDRPPEMGSELDTGFTGILFDQGADSFSRIHDLTVVSHDRDLFERIAVQSVLMDLLYRFRKDHSIYIAAKKSVFFHRGHRDAVHALRDYCRRTLSDATCHLSMIVVNVIFKPVI